MNELAYTSEIALKSSINEFLRNLFGENTRIYGHEVVQGYDAPCFFTSILLTNEKAFSATTSLKTYRCYITLLQSPEDFNEVLCFQVLDKIRKGLIENDPSLSHYVLKVDDRYLSADEFSYSFNGEDQDVFEISFTLQLPDNLTEDRGYDLIEDVTYKQNELKDE